jgi:hypothetical protein
MLIRSPAINVAHLCMMTTTEDRVSQYTHVLSVETGSTLTTQRVQATNLSLAGKLKIWLLNNELRCQVQNRCLLVICEKCGRSVFPHIMFQ